MAHFNIIARANGVGLDRDVDLVHLCLKNAGHEVIYIPSYVPKYPYIRLFSPIYFKISNIQKMGINIRHENDHKSGSNASPRVRI